MARIFISGSSTGLGLMAGELLATQGHAAVGYQEAHRLTADGYPHVFAVNTLAAYVLTALVERPRRLVYLSSGMHHHADAHLDDILWQRRRWNGSTAYAEFYHLREMTPNPQARDAALQERLIDVCASLSGVPLPA